jgi:hypothetical protein
MRMRDAFVALCEPLVICSCGDGFLERFAESGNIRKSLVINNRPVMDEQDHDVVTESR